MRKKILLMTFLTLLLTAMGTGALYAQDNVVTIGSITEKILSGDVPLCNNYEYSISQQYYLSDEIGESKNGDKITHVAFYADEDDEFHYARSLTIYMVNTEDSYFVHNEKNNYTKQLDASNTVFTGNVDFKEGEWNRIELNTPFQYTGKNILLCVVDNTNKWEGTKDNLGHDKFECFKYKGDGTYRSISAKNSDSNYDPTASEIEGRHSEEVPCVQFTFEAAIKFEGEGTATSPYIIADIDDLNNLRNKVNEGEAYEGKYFELTSDITLTEAWTPIGTGSRSSKSYSGNAFKGVFDGGDHAISGLTITSTSGANAAVGLFGIVDGGTVKNLNLTDVNINVASSNLAGAAIGMMLNGATADYITVSGAIVGNDGVGGIVGRLIINGTISNCTNNASVTSSYGGIGGIVGKPYYEDGNNTSTFASITNCINNGTVTAPMYVGGIAGLARANVTGCTNNGAVVGGTQTGGIVGQLMAAGTVSGNENKAKISGKNHLGGIIGDYSQSIDYTYNNVSIANNINRGELAATEQCAAIMGCNNIDGFTDMTATGNVSYYYVEGLELFGNPEDMVIDATNKFILPVAKIDDVEYSTFAEAAAAAQSGDEIILLANIEGNITVPANVTLNGNGFAISGGIFAEGDITFAGVTTAADFDANVANTAVNIPAGASLQLTGSARLVIGHGATFNITGTIENAKTADKATLVPSLIMQGASFTGAGVTFNVTNAYISAPSSYCSSSKSASGTFDFNITNSIWENAGKLAFEAQSTAAKVDFALVNSVLTTGSHLVFATASGEEGVVIDNSLVNQGTSRQIENRGTMTIKNEAVVNGAVATSSNAINPGTIIVENATYAVTGEFSGAAEGPGTLIIKKGANVSVGSITAGANVVVDAEGMAAGDEINFTANLSQFTGTLSVINNDNLDAEIIDVIDGKIVLVEKPVAQIGETEYATLQAAIDACEGENNVITLLSDLTFESNLNDAGKGYFNIADGKKVVLDMNGKTINVTDNSTGNFIVFYNYGEFTVANGTINLTSTNNREWNAESAIFLNRGGIFNIENGIYTHNGGTDMAFVVDNSGNYYGDATTNIYERTLQRNTVETTLTSSYIAIRNRMEQNTHGASGKAILNVEGGTISGTSRAIWAQASSTSETAPATGEINVKGGNIGLIDTPCSTGAVSMTTISGGTVSAFKGEAGELTVTEGTLNEVTLFTAAGETVNDYAVNEDGLYVQAVAQVGVTKYADLQEAIKAAAPAGTVEILADVVVDEWIMFSETLNISSGQIITMNINGLTINGNGKTVTIKSIESAGNGNRLFYDATNLNINNLTINCTDAAANQGGIGLTSGTIENVTFNGGAGVFPGTGNITIEGCTFRTNAHCIYYEEARDYLVVTDNTFELADNANVILLRGNTTFTGNTIVSGRTVNVVSGSPVVIGNNFGQVRFKVYNEATATIEENTIIVLAFNDPEAVVNSTFGENILSEDAQAVLNAVSFPVAQIGDVKYGTLQAAIDAAQDGEEIDLLKSVELTSTLLLTKNNILDGNGFRLTPAEGFTPDGNGAVIVLAANMSGYEANRTYTVKNLIIAEFSTPSRIVRANFCNATIQNCSFVNNNSESIITSAYAVLNVEDNTFTDNTASFAVINVGSDVSDGTALVAEITGNKFYNNEAAIAGIFLASSADVTDNHFKDNTHTGDNANAAAILAGPYTGNMAYTVNINSNAFENAMSKGGTALPSVFAEDWSANYGSTTSFDLSLNYWDGNEPEAGTAYKTSGENPQVTVKSYYRTYEEETKTLGGLVELPQGNQPIGYVSETTIWGQTWTNAKESYVIKVLNAENEVMGTSALNTNLDVTMDGDVEVTWHITLPGITDEDQYWIQEWIAQPNVNNMPAKVELWVDGVKVNEGPVKFNSPDDIHKIYAATADAEGNLIRFYNSIETIVNNEENVNVVLVRDVTGSFETFHNVTLYSGVEGGASITNTYSADYTNFNKVIVKNGVTLNMNRVYSTTAESVNTIEGTMNVVGVYYHSSDAKTEIKNGGKVTTGGMTIVRYNNNPESGIYIYGDGDDTTVEFSCQGEAIGAYSGTFYAEDAVVETKDLRLDYKKDNSEESDVYAQINAKFVDTKLSVSSQLRLYKDAALTLKGATVTAGTVQIRLNATPTINIDNSTIKANSVENLSGATWNAVMDENGYVTFVRTGLAGEGTEANPYLINNLEDLVYFRDQVNGGNNYAGKYVKLADNIDLSSIENWTPIGDITYNDKYEPADNTKVFSGKFNGNGKVISNLKVASTVGGVDTQANVGLFGITGEGAAIKDLTLTNVNIETDGRNVGAIAGFAYKATLSNITVNGDIQIKGGNNVAGIAGMTRHYAMSATGISVIGNDGSAIVGNNIVGGIFAEIAPNGSEQTFKGLNVENVAITGVGGVGGIVGLLTTGTVENVSVKNVVLTGRTDYQGNAMGRIRLGSVAGLMGGKYATIANETVENVTAKNLDGNAVELPVIGANYDAASNATEAKIGDTYYATLQAALDAGGNVTVLSDITLAEKVTVAEDKIVVLDLNGKTIDGTEKVRIAIVSYGDLTIKDSTAEKNGIVKAGVGTAGNAVNICAGTFTLESGNIYSKNNAILIDEQAATINIKGGTITAEPNTNNSAVFYISSISETTVNIEAGTMTGYNGILLWNNTEINITGGSIEATGSVAIQGNGTHDNTLINIGGEETSVKGYYAAIYHPQNGELNIANGTLEGWTGVVVKSGKVTISGGTINGIGTANEYSPVSSGFVDTGDALYVEHYDNSTNSENYGTPVVAVTGGTFNSTNAHPIASYANPNNASNGVEALAAFVEGGTFNKEIASDILAPGFKLEENEDDTYGVVVDPTYGKVAKIGDVYYADLHEAMLAAKAGETVLLISDVNLADKEWEPVSFKGIFDGQGKTIKNLTINKPDVSNTGFITSLNGSFGNVTFENATVTGGENTAVVAGRAGGGNAYAHDIILTGTIKVETTHSGYARAGGIVGGWAYGRYEDIIVDGIDKEISYIKHTGGGDGRYVAGIVGHADDVESYTNCTVKNITISGGWLCGGIAGPGPADGLATGCSVENIDMGADYSGGMFGWYFGNGTIENSTITDVTFTDGSTNNGAIGGYSNNDDATVNNVTIENVTNEDGAPLLDHVAAIDNVYYTSFESALNAAQENETITLLRDIKIAERTVINNRTLTIDGNGKTIRQDEDFDDNAIALFDINGGKVTIKNVTFDGVKEGAAVRTVNTEFAMDNVIAQNCEHTVGQGLFRLVGQNTITNSKFLNNNCSMVITLNYDVVSNTPQLVENCLFEGNKCSSVAALYYVGGASCTIKNSEFVENTVNCNNNGATVYLGFTENNVVTGNIFQENNVVDASSSTRVAGAIFFGYEAEIENNVFVGNTASNANNDVLGQICTSTYYECTIDLSGNYWGGEAPEYGKDYTVQHTASDYDGNFQLDNYYKTFTTDENGNVVLGNIVNMNYVAQVGKLSYETLADAFAAAENETITLLRDTELSEMITIPNGKTVVLDLNGKTITGTDNTSKNFSIIDNRGNLTITDSSDPSTGKITLTATTNSGWSRYSAVIANNPGGKLTIEAGTLEHLGGTDMAYGIDNLTNGKGTYAETVINGGHIKSTYRGIRQFLNGVEAQNILTVNGGTIEGANKSIWMQDPSKNANTGTLTVGEEANLIGDVYLYVTPNSTSWPVEVSIAAAALAEGSEVMTANLPVGVDVQNINGTYGNVNVVAQIDDVKYQSLADAATAAQDGETIQLIWAEGNDPIAMNASLYGNKNVTITGTATVDWSKGFLFVGRGGEGNATLTFDNANLTSASNSGSYGIHVSGREKDANDKYDGTLVINNSTIELDYLINKGTMTLDESTLTVKNGFSVGGRPASETESGEDATATITLSNASKVVVNNHNGMGLGYEAIGVMNIDATSTFETTQAFLVTAKGTMNNAGTVKITGTLTNNGTINFTDLGATLATTAENLEVKLDFENSSAYQVVYENGTYSVALIPVQEQHLVAGWNWYSSYLNITPSALTTALGENGLEVKDQNDVSMIYDQVWGTWSGSLTLDFAKMYMINTTEACELKLAANVLNPADCPVTLNGGWNWIGYPSNVSVNINDALEDLTPNDGDMIKTRNLGHAEYVEAWGGWIGKLTHMIPGEGYMYRNTSGVEKQFVYNVESTRGTVEANYTAENNYWTPNVSKYPFNMTMTAVVDGMTDGNYEVAAFVNGEVRGSARPIYVEQLDAYVLFLTINGDEVEEMSFRLYDIDNDTEYDLNDRFNYSNNAHLGSVSEPYVFSRGTTGINEAAMSNINIYPNPTTIGTEINLEATCDIVEVYNALGVKVAEYQNVDTIDALETAGIYVIRITNNGNVQNCRLVVK